LLDSLLQEMNRVTMSSVSIQIRHRAGSLLTVTVPRPAPAPCSGCGAAGRLRCGVCHAWYCTAFCQASDWPRHRSNCVHPPALLWPDGVRYQGEEVVLSDEVEEQEDTMMTINQLVSHVKDNDDEGTRLNNASRVRQDSTSKIDDVIKETSDESVTVSKPKLDNLSRETKSPETSEKQTSCPISIPQVQSPGGAVSVTSTAITAGTPMSMADDSDTSKCRDAAVHDKLVKRRSFPPETEGPSLPRPPPSGLSFPDLHKPVVSSQIELHNFDECNETSADELISVNDFTMMSMKDIAVGHKDVGMEEITIEDKDASIKELLINNNEEAKTKDITIEDQLVKNKDTVIEHKDVETGQQVVGKRVCEYIVETVAATSVPVPSSKDGSLSKHGKPDDSARTGQVIQGTEVTIDENKESIVNDVQEMPRTVVEMVENTTHTDPELIDTTKDDEVKYKPGEEETKVLVAPTVLDKVTLSRGSLSLGSKMMAVVCHLDTPLVFYICPTTSVEDFTNIFTISQDCPPGMVSPVVGNCCLVQDMDDECWYRGEIIKIVDEAMATLFLLDSGKVINSSVAKLKPLSKDLKSLKGLVSKVNLKGVKAVGKEWSKTDIEKAMHILDVGNDVTTFKLKVVKIDSRGEIFVVMKNMEGKDVAAVMVEAGIVNTEKNNIREEDGEKAQIMFKSGTIPQGLQAVLMLKMVSPMELYFCSVENFVEMEKNMIMWEEAATKADDITVAVKGDPVLACDDGTWYRGVVIQIMSDNMVQVELVDVASCSTLHITQLKKPSAEVMKGEVMAVSCCLESWVKEDRDRVMAKEKWESKVSSMVEYYEEMQVHVVGEVKGQLIVRVPELEEKLKNIA